MNCKLTSVILAGGLGTRLSPVVSDVPKPMASVAGRPFLEYLIAQVREAGCADVVLCVGYKAHVIENYFGDGGKYGVEIRYSREQELLGTAGALALARPLIRSEPFLVLNGDSYCAVDIQALLAHHQARGASATIIATQVEDTSRYGSMVLNDNDAVICFCEKENIGGTGYVNAGIYALNHVVLDLIPAGRACSIEHEVFPTLVGNGLYAFKSTGLFVDIGTPPAFQKAQILFKKGKFPL